MIVRDPELIGTQTSWRRLSPLMLLVHPVQALVGFLPTIIVLLVVGRGVSGSWWSVLAIAGPIVIGIARYYTTTYQVTPSHLQLRTGLVNRNTLTAPLDRVRTVDITATPLHRLLGLATIKVGTGASKPVALDALRLEKAEQMRDALLERSLELATSPGRAGQGSRTDPPTSATADTPCPAVSETTLATFSMSWLRFAPFTLTGLVAVGAVVGFGAQFLDQLNWGAAEQAAQSVTQRVADQPWWLLGLMLAAFVLVVLVLASLLMYAVTYGGFRLTRRAGGTLHVVRGLLATRATTLEERRLRGAVLHEPCLMRPVGGAQADALIVGSLGGSEQDSGSHLLMPPAPRDTVVDVLCAVTGDPDAWVAPLNGHGQAATRRRYLRAVGAALCVPVTVAAVASCGYTAPTWVVIAAILPVPASVLVGRGRATALGHTLTQQHLVARAGVFPRRRWVLRRDGIIGWTWTQTWFQRRVGLVTLRAMTAARPGHVPVSDVPVTVARDLVAATTPDLIDPFLDGVPA